jgi:hypothetical protein
MVGCGRMNAWVEDFSVVVFIDVRGNLAVSYAVAGQ